MWEEEGANIVSTTTVSDRFCLHTYFTQSLGRASSGVGTVSMKTHFAQLAPCTDLQQTQPDRENITSTHMPVKCNNSLVVHTTSNKLPETRHLKTDVTLTIPPWHNLPSTSSQFATQNPGFERHCCTSVAKRYAKQACSVAELLCSH